MSEETGHVAPSWRDVPLTTPPLTSRELRILTAAGYRTWGEVAGATRASLCGLPGFGTGSWFSVRRILRQVRVSHAGQLLAAGASLRVVAAEVGVAHETVRGWFPPAEDNGK